MIAIRQLQATGQYIGVAAYQDIYVVCFAVIGAVLLGIGGYLCCAKC